MLFPLVVGVGVAAAAGGTLYWLKKWAEGRPMPGPVPDVITDPDPQPNGGGGGGGGGQQLDRCSRTGERYDAGRWSSPMHVAAGMIPLGYPAGPKLTDAHDKKMIEKFQTDAIRLGLNGLKGAPPKYVNGKMNACTLLALSNAEALLKAGKWIPRTQSNWFEDNWVVAMKQALGL